MERFSMLVAVHLFLIRDGKVLLLRRFNTGYCDGFYSVPAGHVDGGETVFSAMKREALEEINVDIDNETFEVAQVMHRKCDGHERIDYFFKATNWNGELKNMETNKCDELAWYPLDDLPENMVGYVRAAIENYNNQIKFSLFGW